MTSFDYQPKLEGRSLISPKGKQHYKDFFDLKVNGLKTYRAKSKVSPTYSISSAKLELCDTVLLNRTWEKFATVLDPCCTRPYCWNDSTTVLQWIKMHPWRLECCIGNRVSALQQNSEAVPWQYVPSDKNPADIVSCGCRTTDMIWNMWLSEPQFLLHSPKNWPR